MTRLSAGIDRRTVAAGIVASIAAPTRLDAAAPIKPPASVADWLHSETTAPFAIPRDYLGIHSDHGLGAATPAPQYAYDAIRSHDVNDAQGRPVTQWAQVERTPGQYDWRAVDAWFVAHPAKTRIWVLLGCPKFYQKFPDEPWLYPYLPGGGSPPKHPRSAADFIAALLARYPGMIDFIELWNEPNFGWSGNDAGRDRWRMAKPGFFTGTAADLAALARAVRAVLPPSVKLMAGAWEGQDASTSLTNSLLRFSAAPDGAGGMGRDHVQALSVHAYTYNNDPNAIIAVLRNYIARFAQAGYPAKMDRYVTEVGAEAPVFWSTRAPQMADKIRAVKRWCMIPAALGYKGVYLYKHSLERTLGDPARTPDLSGAIDQMRHSLRGRTLTAAARLVDDTIWLAFADGSTVRA
jgi:hypothetical protein